MGGRPKVLGGMSAAEHEKLLADERRYQKEQEDFRRAQALQDEKDRIQRAADEKDRIAAEEQARIALARFGSLFRRRSYALSCSRFFARYAVL